MSKVNIAKQCLGEDFCFATVSGGKKDFKIIGGYLFFLQLNKIDRQLITICIERCKKVERVVRKRQNSDLVLIETQFDKSKGNQKLI